MLEFYMLEQLAAFAEHGTLSAAGEALHLSQSALSRSMQKLEESLGVTLFERQKNKVALNENGQLAAQYARRLLAQEQDMVSQIRAFDRSRRTIRLGCCAPVPHGELIALLSRLYAGMTISSDLKGDESLLAGLYDGDYQLVVLHRPVDDKALYCKVCGKEKLFLAVPPAHPLAGLPGLYLADLRGQSLLLYTHIGFWHELCINNIPNARMLYQNDREVFDEIVNASALPCFATDVTMAQSGPPEGRVAVPILDEEADATYYLVCKTTDRGRFEQLFRHFEG